MGLDRFANFISKSINNDGIEEINIDNNLRKIVSNHIIFDLNFLIYQEIVEVENEINDIIKVILCLPFSPDKGDKLEIILKSIFMQPHWKLYYIGSDLENRFTGWYDAELTKQGIEEAQQAGSLIKNLNINFNFAFTSFQKRAMAGEIDFQEALLTRVELLSGVSESVIEKVRNQISLTKGAETLIQELHKIGHKVGVVSGGFIDVIEPILKSLKIDYYVANKLEISNGLLTGRITGPIVDSVAKKKALEDFAAQENVSLNQTVAIGDGANDLEMIKAAGLGIAFNAKPKVVAAADTTISTKDLAAVLPLMGINF